MAEFFSRRRYANTWYRVPKHKKWIIKLTSYQPYGDEPETCYGMIEKCTDGQWLISLNYPDLIITCILATYQEGWRYVRWLHSSLDNEYIYIASDGIIDSGVPVSVTFKKAE